MFSSSVFSSTGLGQCFCARFPSGLRRDGAFVLSYGIVHYFIFNSLQFWAMALFFHLVPSVLGWDRVFQFKSLQFLALGCRVEVLGFRAGTSFSFLVPIKSGMPQCFFVKFYVFSLSSGLGHCLSFFHSVPFCLGLFSFLSDHSPSAPDWALSSFIGPIDCGLGQC